MLKWNCSNLSKSEIRFANISMCTHSTLYIHCNSIISSFRSRPRWLSWMRRPTGDQEVAGSTPAEVGNILSWRLTMKYFLRSFSPFRWFKKGSRPRWLSWMRRPTGDQEVAGSTPAEVDNILSWRLIMKYFLRSFSPFRWFKKGSCQFLAKECAQYWLTA